MDKFWHSIKHDEVPKCETCSSIIKPDVTFFGEQLPTRFFELRNQDFKKTDLVIIAGTSLVVYPFASLISSDLPITIPRLLFNTESVGPFRSISTNPTTEELKNYYNYRDVQVLGDCDDGILQLIKELNWLDEFTQLQQSLSTLNYIL